LGGAVLRCSRCGRDLGDGYLKTKCPFCGGLPLIFYKDSRFRPDHSLPGIWRYSSLLPQLSKRISKGEGLTPISRIGKIYVKNERFNPTGSYADRASAVIVSYIASSGLKRATIKYEEAFTRSMAYYLANSEVYETIYCIEDPLEVSVEDFLYLLEKGEVSTCNKNPETAIIEYSNPLTIEGLKTIVYELYERRIRFKYVVVPAKTGVLAISLAKGIRELEEAGLDIDYEVVAAIKKGDPVPEIIRGESRVKLVEIDDLDIMKSLKELADRGIYTAPLSAVGYHVASQLGEAVAIITIGYRTSGRRRGSELRRVVMKTLERLGRATAYEIWRENQGYSLRGIYKAVRSMAEEGVVCEEVVARGNRKVRRYSICQ
jgi:threonine synthase